MARTKNIAILFSKTPIGQHGPRAEGAKSERHWASKEDALAELMNYVRNEKFHVTSYTGRQVRIASPRNKHFSTSLTFSGPAESMRALVEYVSSFTPIPAEA